jgi:competence protein ComEC
MSFAATLALVAAYERGMRWGTASRDTALGIRLALWGWRHVAALLFASLVAGLATTPYAAFHFHRLAPYGVLANLLAMPVVSVWVMPAGLLALLAMPFGLDAPLWGFMGKGIDWMVAIAEWVTRFPGAVGRVHAFGVGALLLLTLGLVVICLFRSRLRWTGAIPIAAGACIAVATSQPVVFVSSSGDAVAVRRPAGSLSALRFGSDTFAIRDWLAGDADARLPNDAGLKDGFACDPEGCVARFDDGRVIAVSRTPAAIAEDCGRAALVITQREAPPGCAATIIDRNMLRFGGAAVLYRGEGKWRIEQSKPVGYDRPWATSTDRNDRPAEAARRTRQDATPRPDDLEPGD